MNAPTNARKFAAIAAAFGAAVTLAACSNDDTDTKTDTATETNTASEQAAPAAEKPTAAQLNEVLARATNPQLPMEERVKTVQGGENARELFDVMTQAKQESGADFQVVEPILPGYTPNEVLAAVNFTQPNQGPSVAENVSFVFEDNTWKLSQSWACTLITNTVTPEQVPAMCNAQGGQGTEAPAQGGQEAPAPAQGGQAPAQGGQAPAQGGQEAPAPAQGGNAGGAPAQAPAL
ncbi:MULTISPECIES: hypothetical protein [unclassified Corynebacterium]|uniref:hypothetical protein n=1 Tax=unclassified Corynebacterium TaxID=2624378 RepID=UPI0021AAFE60|nr:MULTISPECIES: hypothetical protein [unclassified Corynebacterium]MCT1451479.1 hypothetical protein [Corynebacterium sp. p3-SID1145]MCT1460514.1 hypothetical protein [Corynebacterium sp. p3-SID1140]MDN8593628.1 hypothetical protein [Corynebacterium sp. P4_F2]WKK55752.1 hypothetical protein QYR03_00480 [Corynebacterium sp. P4-C1]WKK63159.1 hypothetical protein QYR04_10180 [Corynebacterium sp. P8-C1]